MQGCTRGSTTCSTATVRSRGRAHVDRRCRGAARPGDTRAPCVGRGAQVPTGHRVRGARSAGVVQAGVHPVPDAESSERRTGGDVDRGLDLDSEAAAEADFGRRDVRHEMGRKREPPAVAGGMANQNRLLDGDDPTSGTTDGGRSWRQVGPKSTPARRVGPPIRRQSAARRSPRPHSAASARGLRRTSSRTVRRDPRESLRARLRGSPCCLRE